MDQNDRLPSAAFAEGVAVEPYASQIDELAAHQNRVREYSGRATRSGERKRKCADMAEVNLD